MPNPLFGPRAATSVSAEVEAEIALIEKLKDAPMLQPAKRFTWILPCDVCKRQMPVGTLMVCLPDTYENGDPWACFECVKETHRVAKTEEQWWAEQKKDDEKRAARESPRQLALQPPIALQVAVCCDICGDHQAVGTPLVCLPETNENSDPWGCVSCTELEYVPKGYVIAEDEEEWQRLRA